MATELSGCVHLCTYVLQYSNIQNWGFVENHVLTHSLNYTDVSSSPFRCLIDSKQNVICTCCYSGGQPLPSFDCPGLILALPYIVVVQAASLSSCNCPCLTFPLHNIILIQAASPCLLASLASLALLPLPLLAKPDADPAPDLGQLQQTGIFRILH